MEAGESLARGAREADVAPAPAAAERRWWGPADPVPLGLAGFALTTFILGVVNTGLISKADVLIVLTVAAVYGGLAQLLAGMWAFAERNTFAAVAFSSYGAFWLSFVLLIQIFSPLVIKAGATPLVLNHGIALYLFCWGFFTFYMWIGTFRLNIGLNLVFLTLWVAYLLLGLGNLGHGNTTITHIGGAVTIACACLAWYVAISHVFTRTFGRELLPLFPLTRT